MELNDNVNNSFYKTTISDIQDEHENSFEFLPWVMRFLRNWYLFVIAIVIALGLAYLKNRQWKPIYKVSANVLIEEGGRTSSMSGNQALMQGFGIEMGYRNVNNQVILFSSYDIIRKAIERLPLDIDYIRVGRFKSIDLYKNSPIEIMYDFIANNAYERNFDVKDIDGKKFSIAYEGDDYLKKFSLIGEYGKPIQNSTFFITVNKTSLFYDNYDLKVRFRDKARLELEYDSRLVFNFVMESSTVVTVSLTGENPYKDQDFINALADAFVEDNLARKNNAANRTIAFIDNQLLEISDSLNVSESRLKSFRIDNQIVDLNSYSSNLLNQVNKFDEQQAMFNLKESYFNYLTSYLNKNVQDEEVVAPSSLGITDPILMEQVKKLNELQAKRQVVGNKNPFYDKYTLEIQNVKNSIFEVLRNLRVALDIEKVDLKKRSAAVESKISDLPNKESKMVAFQRNYKIHDGYYTFLLQKKAESQIQKASNSPDNIILDRARPLGIVNHGEQGKNYLVFLLIGLLIPSLYVVLKELLKNKIVHKNDVMKVSPFPYLGSVRHMEDTDTFYVQKRPKSSFAESFRAIRTRIEFIAQRQSPIKILVTSTESGDGKSTFSFNMAAMYALTGRKTILIDLDLRKPSIGKTLSISNPYCISNYIIGQVELKDIIIKDKNRKYDVMLAGTVPPNPGELVRSDKLKSMFAELSKEYDHIVIDSSPIGLVADAYPLSALVDVTMYIVRSDKTNKKFFANIINQLYEDKIPNMYVILNDLDEKKMRYIYSYNEYRNYSYYSADLTAESKEYFED
jgi:capsular exopolysaccharide synthesis family protein